MFTRNIRLYTRNIRLSFSPRSGPGSFHGDISVQRRHQASYTYIVRCSTHANTHCNVCALALSTAVVQHELTGNLRSNSRLSFSSAVDCSCFLQILMKSCRGIKAWHPADNASLTLFSCVYLQVQPANSQSLASGYLCNCKNRNAVCETVLFGLPIPMANAKTSNA